MKRAIIGRREWFSIPEYGVDWVRGKIDSGARTSSLHATEIEPFGKGGSEWVRFKTIDDLACEAPVIFAKRVKSSNGIPSKRYFVEIVAETLDDQEHVLLVSLTCRASMKCPLLLGRRALTQFFVDCTRSQLLGKI
ncbi:MAG: hypothetical protein ACJAVK_002562 [Akkermansiaceae bacterium]|jgi:hypothetical protein